MSTLSNLTVPTEVLIPAQAPPVVAELPRAAVPLREPAHRHTRACYWDLRSCGWVCES